MISDDTYRLRIRQIAAMPALWIGVLISVLLAVYVAHWERQALHNELRELAVDRAQVLQSSMRSATEVLYSLASLHAATGAMALEPFTLFAQDAVRRHPELQAVEWIPRVARTQRAEYEAAMREAGYADFLFTQIDVDGTLIPAAERDEYFPVYFVEPFDGNAAAHGFDLGANAQRRTALEQARDTGLPAVTAPIRLAQETATQQGFLIFYPVYAAPEPTNVAERQERLQGFALAVFRAEDLSAAALRDLAERGVTVTIYDAGYDRNDSHTLLSHHPGQPGPDRWWHRLAPWQPALLQWDLSIDVAGRRWHLRFEPTAHFSSQRSPLQSIAALLTGLAMTFLLVAHLAAAARRTRQVAAANTALQTEIGERERAVKAAQAANRAKSDFLANMSHEIRTPLNAVLGYAQLLKRDTRLDVEQQHSVHAIIVSGNHLLNQINAVLDFSKIETGRMELQTQDLHINELLRELVLMFRPRCQEKGLELHVQFLPEGADAVHTDGGKLRQILINLMGNAVRFTSKGQVMLGCRVTDDGQYRFDVVDTGQGIPTAVLEKVFEPFFQGQWPGQSGGTGLGLAIAQRQTRLLGGELTVVSEVHEGSRFTLLLPLPPALSNEMHVRPQTIRWRLPDGQKLRALIVDDVAANREILHRLLTSAGCECAQAHDRETACAQLQAAFFDVVFIDLRMPDGDGLQLLPRLREIQPGIAAIAYTAMAYQQDRERSLQAGCQAFVAKPVQAGAVFDALESALQISFIRDWQAESTRGTVADPSRLSLPAELLERMLTASELHSTTALKICLEELPQYGRDGIQLAERLRQMMQAYDMRGISRLLMTIRPQTVEADRGVA